MVDFTRARSRSSIDMSHTDRALPTASTASDRPTEEGSFCNAHVSGSGLTIIIRACLSRKKANKRASAPRFPLGIELEAEGASEGGGAHSFPGGLSSCAR